ncbi:MAG: DUF2914 domain-containing protein [Patescibacteria group bacterium]|nr:DUF2914 domain-containing protein [Patescibacteria group bacterium]
MFRWLWRLWERYEQHLRVAALGTGFIFDLFIADRPDSAYNNLILLSYLVIAGGSIILLNLRTAKYAEHRPNYQPIFLLLVLQFCFGGLASNLLVLYGRSGTLAASTLFFLILGGMVIGNEFMRSRYAQLRFNIVIYYLLLLTYVLIAAPTFIFHSIGTLEFLASGFLSLVIIAGFLWLVYVLVLRKHEREAHLYEVSVLVGLVFVFFNGLYFLGIIPPVPLSLKDVGVYHSLERLEAPAGGSGSIYSARYEPPAWFVFWRDTSSTFTVTLPTQAHCFSSVFAPAKLSTPIYHVWQRYNEAEAKWVTTLRTSFPISGGRAEGYRGFTSAQVSPGKWRCNVETQNGSLIGRISFTVEQSPTLPELSQTAL